MKILVTGAAGFIGFYTVKTLLDHGHDVIGIDNISDYYDVDLKNARLDQLRSWNRFAFETVDIVASHDIDQIFAQHKPDLVVHLAAQAGVRYSITHPQTYIQSNLVGFGNILEACRHHRPQHLVFASSSSVYGLNAKLPFRESDKTDSPVSLYGATKKANELMAHAYAHLYGLPITGLRFFTVYGPWGRPDMAPFIFTKRIIEGKAIEIYNNGHHSRDFTYIDDIVKGVVSVLDRIPAITSATQVPYRIYNIGNNNPVTLMDFIACIEQATGQIAIKTYLPFQAGDVEATYADIDDLNTAIGFKPNTSIETGMERFVRWYRDYYNV